MVRLYPYFIGLVFPIIVFSLKIYPKDISNFKDILLANISMSSIAVGFLAAAITMLPSLSNNLFVQRLKELGAYKKLLFFLYQAIIFLFISSLFSIFGLFLNYTEGNVLNFWFLIAWSFVFSTSLCLVFRVLANFLKFLIISSDE